MKRNMRDEGHKEKRDFQGAIKIFQALSAVEEDLLEKSEASEKTIPFWIYNRVLAACLCLFVIGGAAYAGITLVNPLKKDMSGAEERMGLLQEDLGDSTMEAAIQSPESVQKPSGETAGAPEAVPPEDAEAAGEDRVDSAQAGNGGEVKNVEEALQEKQADGIQENGVAADSMTTGENRTAVKEEEARALEGVGMYVPTALPSGYRFEEAYQITGENGESTVTVLWVNGMDTIHISITRCTEEMLAGIALTDTSKPERFDVHLYEVPYADTVPEEYRVNFDNPVFSEQDFTKEVVESRMKSYADNGDTDTPNGRFSVLYEDGILVRFNGDGSAQDIWKMFQSMGRF